MKWDAVAQHLSSVDTVTPGPQGHRGPSFAEANRSFVSEVGGSGLIGIEEYISWYVDHNTRPEHVPLEHLRAMRFHPVVYLAERASTGLARTPDLYHVQAKRDRDRAEVEAWLWPRLPQLLPQIVRAFVFGSVPILFDWSAEDLTFDYKRPLKDEDGKLVGSKTVTSTHRGYELIESTSDVWLCDAKLQTRGRKLAGIEVGGRVYPAPTRAHYAIWDREFGEWRGNGARRRAFRPYLKSEIYERFKARYMERSVDPPRVIKAPGGTTTDSTGESKKVGELVAAIFASLYSGGVAMLPSGQDGSGAPLYEIEVMDLPDRSEVYDRSLNRQDGKILISYLVSPGMTGVSDSLSGGGARLIEDLFGTFVGELLEFVAQELTKIVEVVWEINHSSGVPPEIKPNELPDRVQKLYLEVLKLAVQSADLGKRVNVNELINMLNVPLREDAEEADAVKPDDEERPGRPPGRPRDAAGEREKRREDAETPEGREDTGAPRGDA